MRCWMRPFLIVMITAAFLARHARAFGINLPAKIHGTRSMSQHSSGRNSANLRGILDKAMLTQFGQTKNPKNAGKSARAKDEMNVILRPSKAIVVIEDRSGSMSWVLQTIDNELERRDIGDQYIFFARRAKRSDTMSPYDGPNIGHGTSIFPAFEELFVYLKSSMPKQVDIVFISDGEDNSYVQCRQDFTTHFSKFREELPDINHRLFTIGVTKDFPCDLVMTSIDSLQVPYLICECEQVSEYMFKAYGDEKYICLPFVIAMNSDEDASPAFDLLEKYLQLNEPPKEPTLDDCDRPEISQTDLAEMAMYSYNACINRLAGVYEPTTEEHSGKTDWQESQILRTKAVLHAIYERAKKEEGGLKRAGLRTPVFAHLRLHQPTSTTVLGFLNNLNTILDNVRKGSIFKDLTQDERRTLAGFTYKTGKHAVAAAKYHLVDEAESLKSLFDFVDNFSSNALDRSLEDTVGGFSADDYWCDAKLMQRELQGNIQSFTDVMNQIPVVGPTIILGNSPSNLPDGVQIDPYVGVWVEGFRVTPVPMMSTDRLFTRITQVAAVVTSTDSSVKNLIQVDHDIGLDSDFAEYPGRESKSFGVCEGLVQNDSQKSKGSSVMKTSLRQKDESQIALETVHMVLPDGTIQGTQLSHHLVSVMLTSNPQFFHPNGAQCVLASIAVYLLKQPFASQSWVDRQLDWVYSSYERYYSASTCKGASNEHSRFVQYLDCMLSPDRFRLCLISDAQDHPKEYKCQGLSKAVLAMWMLARNRGEKLRCKGANGLTLLEMWRLALVAEMFHRSNLELDIQTILDEDIPAPEAFVKSVITRIETSLRLDCWHTQMATDKIIEEVKDETKQFLLNTRFKAIGKIQTNHAKEARLLGLSLQYVEHIFQVLADIAGMGIKLSPLSDEYIGRLLQVGAIQDNIERASDPTLWNPMQPSEIDSFADSLGERWFKQRVMQESEDQAKMWWNEFAIETRDMARAFPREHIEQFEAKFTKYNLTKNFGLSAKTGLSTFLSCYPKDPMYLRPLELDDNGYPVRPTGNTISTALHRLLQSNAEPIAPALHKALRSSKQAESKVVAEWVKCGSLLDDPAQFEKDLVLAQLKRNKMEDQLRTVMRFYDGKGSLSLIQDIEKARELESEWTYDDFEATVLKALPALIGDGGDSTWLNPLNAVMTACGQILKGFRAST